MNDENDITTEGLSPLERRAIQIGRDNGKSAASWVFDGNTTRETYEHFLKGIQELDPQVMDSVREPSLSGEFAGDYTEDQLRRDLDFGDDTPNGWEAFSELCDVYLEAARCAFWETLELECKFHLS